MASRAVSLGHCPEPALEELPGLGKGPLPKGGRKEGAPGPRDSMRALGQKRGGGGDGQLSPSVEFSGAGPEFTLPGREVRSMSSGEN